MINLKNPVKNVVSTIKRKTCTNNTQRVLLDLIRSRGKDGWVARTAISVPSVGARIRDLRKTAFGSFKIECATASDINRPIRKNMTGRQTFYRVVPNTVTVDSIRKAFKGVI